MRGEFLLGLSREVREGAGVEAGDDIDVRIELDVAPREVEVPEALATALASDPQAATSFESMSFTHRKEYVRWISDDEAGGNQTAPRPTGTRHDPGRKDPLLTAAINGSRSPSHRRLAQAGPSTGSTTAGLAAILLL